jgi:hypothetical protein
VYPLAPMIAILVIPDISGRLCFAVAGWASAKVREFVVNGFD